MNDLERVWARMQGKGFDRSGARLCVRGPIPTDRTDQSWRLQPWQRRS